LLRKVFLAVTRMYFLAAFLMGIFDISKFKNQKSE